MSASPADTEASVVSGAVGRVCLAAPGGGTGRLIRAMSPFLESTTVFAEALRQVIELRPHELNNTVFEFVLQAPRPVTEEILILRRGYLVQYVRLPAVWRPDGPAEFRADFLRLGRLAQEVHRQAQRAGLPPSHCDLVLGAPHLVQVRWVLGLGDLVRYWDENLGAASPAAPYAWAMYHLVSLLLPGFTALYSGLRGAGPPERAEDAAGAPQTSAPAERAGDAAQTSAPARAKRGNNIADT